MDPDLRTFWVSSVIIFIIIAFVLVLPARGQTNHDRHHAQYQGWQSNLGYSCCNNLDCGELPERDVRERAGHIEVLVKDTRGDVWVTVQERHLIKKGTGGSPDWSVNHACILAEYPDRASRDRLVCFMPAAKF